MGEKPLHVLVAEALGWTDCKPCGHATCPPGFWIGDAPLIGGAIRESHTMPRYDTDWSATGPLIEKLPVTVGRYASDFMDGRLYAVSPSLGLEHGPDAQMERTGDTPLAAVCNLIIALREAGRLDA